jgi:16S rRNA (uracil1498-N3)-methyltransferase
MKHIPHVVIPAPWDGSSLSLSISQWRHLTKVLRMKRGETITYTDGLGTFGTGELGGQVVERGEEEQRDRPTELTLAVAPPSNKDRQRFLVEKLTELGVARLIWLETRHGKNRITSASKVFSWILAATEQSRGSWLMEASPDLVKISDLEGRKVACRPGGESDAPECDVVLIGPEGGFAEDELPEDVQLWDLGPNILRVETAALVATARLSG